MSLHLTENDRDVEILHTNPKELIVRYQNSIRAIVSKYVTSGMFSWSDFDDVVQSVNVSLLERLPAIQRHYTGIALLKTYVSAIVRNICLNLHKKDARAMKTVELSENLTDGPVSPADRHLIVQEASRFRVILDLYHTQRPKLLLCLKLYFRLPVAAKEIKSAYPRCTIRETKHLVQQFGEDYEQMDIHQIYKIITPFMNKYENKSNSADALRKWTDSKIQEIIRILNGVPPRCAFDKETLRILVEDYYFPFLDEQ